MSGTNAGTSPSTGVVNNLGPKTGVEKVGLRSERVASVMNDGMDYKKPKGSTDKY